MIRDTDSDRGRARRPTKPAARRTRGTRQAKPDKRTLARAAALRCAARMDLLQARRVWFARQGLLAQRPRPLADLLAEHGWLSTLGGTAYLACRARSLHFARRELDDAVFADHGIANVPAVRGCMMLVPQADLGLALRAALPDAEKAAARAAAKCGFPIEEVEDLGRAIQHALERGPATPDELRERLGPGKVRSLGDAGKKIGESSTLTVALKLFAARGILQRLPENDTVAAARVRYGLFAHNPLHARGLPEDAAGIARELVARYLQWAAPATAAEIARWTGLGKRAVAAALAALEAEELEVGGRDGTHYAPRGDRFVGGALPDRRRIVFLTADDPFFRLRGGLADLSEAALPEVTVGRQRLLADRAWFCHLVVDSGTVVGAFDWHPERRCIVWRPFAALPADDVAAIDREAKAVGDFIGRELGDLRMSSIDSLPARLERVAAIEAIG